jgi:hypothetical protein
MALNAFSVQCILSLNLTLRQNSLPTWFPHCPTWMLIISLGIVLKAYAVLNVEAVAMFSNAARLTPAAWQSTQWPAPATDAQTGVSLVNN